MKAYIRALRAYNDVLASGRIAATPAGEAVAKLIADAIKLPVEQVSASTRRRSIPTARSMSRASRRISIISRRSPAR